MKYFSFEKNDLFYNNELIKTFAEPIDEMVEYNKHAVILLNRDFYKRDNENVVCIDDKGKQHWRVPKYEYIDNRSPFVGIDVDGNNPNNVRLVNWDSSFVIIEVSTGKVIVDAFSSRKGRRPW